MIDLSEGIPRLARNDRLVVILRQIVQAFRCRVRDSAYGQGMRSSLEGRRIP